MSLCIFGPFFDPDFGIALIEQLVMQHCYGYHRSMDVEPSIAPLGALIGVPARANMLSAMFDGRALTATELAFAARVTPQTASSHLSKLIDAGLLVAERHGRFRYYRLAGPHVAEALEPLTHISPHRPVPVRGRSDSIRQLREARFCYDHLAGHLGVLITAAMVKNGFLTPSGRDYDLSEAGRSFCADFGLDIESISAQRRVLARQCLDWSERRPHLAGSLGAALANTLLDRGWIAREESGRRVAVTEAGRSGFRHAFGLVL
jgi:DNA-binding transcriptional ArsR family regulator